ncbi:MAG TPA: lytic transglycosylase domain-containing protein [Thermoanaerobaculia bacterium]|nr:lytic transglycosylase domain-containing protein [Thermoanaerobaculia bacterium]
MLRSVLLFLALAQAVDPLPATISASSASSASAGTAASDAGDPVAATAASPDPRPALVELELAGRNGEALARAQQEAADRPAAARQLGFDYLRGHLLELLGRPAEAVQAYVAAISSTPRLAFYSRYRLAVEQDQLGHPEVAAGLLAAAIAAEPTSPQLPAAVHLLTRTFGRGGDCRLLRGLRLRQLPAPERRAAQLAQADCDLRTGAAPSARGLLVALLEENHQDDVARAAADRLVALLAEGERGKVPMLVGLTFFEHRELDRALRQLGLLLSVTGKARPASARELAEARFAIGRVQYWQGHYEQAASIFGEGGESAPSGAERARWLLQQGRSYEMLGDWQRAVASFRLAFLADPAGVWAAPSLLATLRLEWRRGNEASGSSILAMLSARPKWRDSARRAALFLAASDLVRGRRDRAGAWLEGAALGSSEEDGTELAYWRGRLAELQGDGAGAVSAYLLGLRTDPFHPLSQAALARLAREPLAASAATLGRKLGASRRPEELSSAWLLLGNADAAGRLAERKLRTLLAADQEAAPYLRMNEVPVASWPLWASPPRRPQEMLLALGAWHDGAAAARDHFPAADPSLAFTGSLLLARTGETARSIALAEALRDRLPERVPLAFLPPAFRQCLYPLAYREPLLAEGRLRGVDPYLLAALIRVASRFDPQAVSPAAARGLTQFALATARRVAGRIGIERLEADDLDKPEVAIDLGGAYLAELLRTFRGAPHVAIAAYDAGESEAALWRNYCFSPEPAEYFTKVGFRETRNFLGKVLSTWAQYRRLYS